MDNKIHLYIFACNFDFKDVLKYEFILFSIYLINMSRCHILKEARVNVMFDQ